MEPRVHSRDPRSQARSVVVTLGERSYRSHISTGCLYEFGALVGDVISSRRVVVLSTPVVYRMHGQVLAKALQDVGLHFDVVLSADGEDAKRLEEAARLWSELAAMDIDRGDTLIAFGGGALGDVAGFVASTYLRGIPFVHVPTTLLAQVDSSIGGKTAINFGAVKNSIGTYAQPSLVVADPSVLGTLPNAAFRTGIAEVIKDGVVADSDFCAWLQTQVTSIKERHLPVLEEMIERAVAIKARAVSIDEHDSGARQLLNFGHTIGHVLEALSGFRLPHGEAVAIGMVAECRISERLGITSSTTERAVRRLNEVYGLPTEMPEYFWRDTAATLRALKGDKKRRTEVLKLVVVPKLGEATIALLQPSELLKYADCLRP